MSPFQFLSDEIAVVAVRPPRLVATPFRSTIDDAERRRVSSPLPLLALIALDKGAEFSLLRLARTEAFRVLLDVLKVPMIQQTCAVALADLGELVERVPVYRMAWTPVTPPWEVLLARLALDFQIPGASGPD